MTQRNIWLCCIHTWSGQYCSKFTPGCFKDNTEWTLDWGFLDHIQHLLSPTGLPLAIRGLRNMSLVTRFRSMGFWSLLYPALGIHYHFMLFHPLVAQPYWCQNRQPNHGSPCWSACLPTKGNTSTPLCLSWRPGTRDQYNSIMQQWGGFCAWRQIHHVLHFLSDIYERGLA